MEGITVERPFEIRVGTKELHDQYLVPDDGDVDFVGTSLGGVGKVHSVMGTLGPETSQHVRKTCEDLWKKASALPVQSASDEQQAG